MNHLNFGDVLFQFIPFAFMVLLIILIVSIVRSSSTKKNQLNRIEKKVDDIQQQLNQGPK